MRNIQREGDIWVDNITSVALCDFSVSSVVKREEPTTENHKANTEAHEERIKNFNEVTKEYSIPNKKTELRFWISSIGCSTLDIS